MSKAIIAVDKSGSYRVYMTITTDLVQEAAQIHNTTPLASAGLGRVLTAAGLMGIMLKEEDNKLTLQFKGDGPAKQILATGYGNGIVKGYIANPDVDLPLKAKGKLDVGASLGIGELTVIKDLGMKDPYLGTIALVSGEIAEDLTAYFFLSEQQNSSVALGVKIERDHTIDAAGGMIIQMLPQAEEGAVDALEKMIGGLDSITAAITRVRERGKGLSEAGLVRALLDDLFQDMPELYKPEVLEERDIRWMCDCSYDRLEQVLMTVGQEELEDMIREDGEAELQCQFCLKKYHFDQEALEGILAKISKKPAS